MLDKLIPAPYRMLALLAAVVVVLIVAAGTGALVNGWRLESGMAAERASLQDTITRQKADIAQLQADVRVANVQISNYAVRTTQAEKVADSALAQAGLDKVAAEKRIERLRAMSAKDCAEVLDNYTRMQP